MFGDAFDTRRHVGPTTLAGPSTAAAGRRHQTEKKSLLRVGPTVHWVLVDFTITAATIATTTTRTTASPLSVDAHISHLPMAAGHCASATTTTKATNTTGTDVHPGLRHGARILRRWLLGLDLDLVLPDGGGLGDWLVVVLLLLGRLELELVGGASAAVRLEGGLAQSESIPGRLLLLVLILAGQCRGHDRLGRAGWDGGRSAAAAAAGGGSIGEGRCDEVGRRLLLLLHECLHRSLGSSLDSGKGSRVHADGSRRHLVREEREGRRGHGRCATRDGDHGAGSNGTIEAASLAGVGLVAAADDDGVGAGIGIGTGGRSASRSSVRLLLLGLDLRAALQREGDDN